ncbi:hypothetical protein AB4Z09_18255 [Rhodococcus sp. TAF43]
MAIAQLTATAVAVAADSASDTGLCRLDARSPETTAPRTNTVRQWPRL